MVERISGLRRASLLNREPLNREPFEPCPKRICAVPAGLDCVVAPFSPGLRLGLRLCHPSGVSLMPRTGHYNRSHGREPVESVTAGNMSPVGATQAPTSGTADSSGRRCSWRRGCPACRRFRRRSGRCPAPFRPCAPPRAPGCGCACRWRPERDDPAARRR